jgi:hypothetical protein
VIPIVRAIVLGEFGVLRGKQSPARLHGAAFDEAPGMGSSQGWRGGEKGQAKAGQPVSSAGT